MQFIFESTFPIIWGMRLAVINATVVFIVSSCTFQPIGFSGHCVLLSFFTCFGGALETTSLQTKPESYLGPLTTCAVPWATLTVTQEFSQQGSVGTAGVPLQGGCKLSCGSLVRLSGLDQELWAGSHGFHWGGEETFGDDVRAQVSHGPNWGPQQGKQRGSSRCPE